MTSEINNERDAAAPATANPGVTKRKKKASNEVSLFFLAENPAEQQAIGRLALNGNLVRSPWDTQQVPVTIKDYEILTDAAGDVSHVRLTGVSVQGSPVTLTYAVRPQDASDLERLVYFHTSGKFKMQGGRVYLQESRYASNRGQWCGNALMHFVKRIRTAALPEATPQPPAGPVAPIQPVAARGPIPFMVGFQEFMTRVTRGEVAGPTEEEVSAMLDMFEVEDNDV